MATFFLPLNWNPNLRAVRTKLGGLAIDLYLGVLSNKAARRKIVIGLSESYDSSLSGPTQGSMNVGDAGVNNLEMNRFSLFASKRGW